MRLIGFAVHISPYLSYALLIHSLFSSTPAWSDATVLNLTHGPQGNDEVDTTYWKSTILHEYVFGYEIPDLIMLLKMKISAIDLKIPPDDVATCYFPIVQSGGSYDFFHVRP